MENEKENHHSQEAISEKSNWEADVLDQARLRSLANRLEQSIFNQLINLRYRVPLENTVRACLFRRLQG